MLLESDCGIGIRGKEGEQVPFCASLLSQAARAGDFVLSEFRFLRRLMCVQGVNSLSRSWSITGYSLYKSVVLCGCQSLYSLLTLFSGSSLFNSFHLTFYSIALFVRFLLLFNSRFLFLDSFSNGFSLITSFSMILPSMPIQTSLRRFIQVPILCGASFGY